MQGVAMMLYRPLFGLLIFVCSVSVLNPQAIYRYRETTGSTSEIRDLEVQKTQNGYVIKTGFSSFETDSSRAVLRWTMDNPSEGISFTAYLSGKKIMLNGTFKHKSVKKEYDTGGKPWFMLQYFSLSELAGSGNSRMEFYAINPLSLEGSILEAVRVGAESVMVDGTKLWGLKIRVSLTGLLAPFWSANFWFNQDYHPVCLRFEMNKGPGTPTTISELIQIISQ
jgi:hypothetical protein